MRREGAEAVAGARYSSYPASFSLRGSSEGQVESAKNISVLGKHMDVGTLYPYI